MKKILGLDLGTNSIGWAVIQQDFQQKKGDIKGLGSRIIPMSQDILDKFGTGVSVSQTADRTHYRGVRRLRQRALLRRERLHRVLNILGFLPEHYAESINFEDKPGQFKDKTEPKLNYIVNDEGQFEFLFKESFEEMIAEFHEHGIENKVPYDWTLYYLRKKALEQKISKEELAWVILNFNQKRGYYQLRGEENEDESKTEEFHALTVSDVVATDQTNSKGTWYDVILENGWVYRRQSTEPLDNWVGKQKEFIVTTQLDKEGNPKRDKEGDVSRSFRAVKSEEDWAAIKKKTEQDVMASGKTVGQYIYETLLTDPQQKIRGKLVKTIERKFYKEELEKILKKQQEFHDELGSPEMYKACLDELYPRNEAHQNNIKNRDFVYLFLNDIIFYQRPLKSQKSTIAGCSYESRKYKKTVTEKDVSGNEIEKVVKVNEPIPAISKSHPLYQEFRLWQFLKNLKIYQNEGEVEGKLAVDIDITDQVLAEEEDWIDLFDALNKKKDVDQKFVINFLIGKDKIKKKDKDNYRWNYVEDKKYPTNETRAMFLSRLSKLPDIDPEDWLTRQREEALWHIVYSVTDKAEFEQALKTFASKNNVDPTTFAELFKKMPPFDSDYGAFSAKAIKKLLPLMRRGKYWDENAISSTVKDRVYNIVERLETINYDKDKIDDRVTDDDIPARLLKSFIPFKNENPLKGLNTYQAGYAVYDRHSEPGDLSQWKSPTDIDNYLKGFKQHSLRNPIVEQVVTETLRVVRDIWQHYGNGETGFFDEIHVELGRDMKNPAKKRKDIADRVNQNENTNNRIKEILEDLKNDQNVEGDIRPYSPSHQEILKIYEEGVSQNPDASYASLKEDAITKIRKNSTPTKTEIARYKLWLEQGYISPYTGQVIPLTRLFTTDYQIEHIIPQSKYFDDSLGNKIICESAVNELKDASTAYSFIKNNAGRIVELGGGRPVKVLALEHFESHCNQYFKHNRTKLKNLLSEEVPEGFIERQMNDSRYISKLVKGLLSNVVRDDNDEEATSKHLLPVTGAVTSKIKQDWGLNDKWNELVAYRFKRLNEMTESEQYGFWDKAINAFRIQVPHEIAKGFSKKRIDHRHHALDALVVACTTRKHTHYLNALNSEKKNYGLRDQLLIKNKQGHYTKTFQMPWDGFPVEAREKLEKTVVSFKQNLRVINKSVNKTWQWKNEEGVLKKKLVEQVKGENWAVRKPLHKESVYGKVKIKRIKSKPVTFNKALEDIDLIVNKTIKNEIKQKNKFYKGDIKLLKKYFKDQPIKIDGEKVDKVDMYEVVEGTANRVALSEKFGKKQLESITDSGIQKILINHLKKYVDQGKDRYDLAFNPDGVDELNKNIEELNDGKPHQPIYKVRLYEEGNRFNLGYTGNKKDKFVEAAKGTNLFFNVYWNPTKKEREYETVPFNEVIEHQKQVAHLPAKERTPAPIDREKGMYLFSLSPNDLVYVPTDEEMANPELVDFTNLSKEQASRVYKMVSSTGRECHFVQNLVSNLIRKYDAKSKVGEFGSLNKSERTIEDFPIKSRCWKISLDRLGIIQKVSKGSMQETEQAQDFLHL